MQPNDLLAFLTPFFDWLTFKAKRKSVAAAVFRESFTEALSQCNSTKSFRIKQLLASNLDQHERAVHDYLPYLDQLARSELIKCWKKYKELHANDTLNAIIPEFGEEEGFIRELSEREQRELSLGHIKKLISFSE